MKRLIFLYVLSLTAFHTAIAQDQLAKQWHYADSLFRAEAYFDCVTECKRLLFFDSTKTYAFDAHFLAAKSYKKGARLADALRYFTKAEMFAQTKDEQYDAILEKIKIYMVQRNTDIAHKRLMDLERDSLFSEKKNELIYWKGWIYIFADSWKKAANQFGKLDSTKDLRDFCNQVDEKKYSVGWAKGLSYIIPGAGQVYTGEYLNGLLSLGWNVLWGYLAIDAFAAERIFDGAMITNFLWMRFYRGNLQNAEKFAVEKNQKIINQAIEFLQYNYKGPKP